MSGGPQSRKLTVGIRPERQCVNKARSRWSREPSAFAVRLAEKRV